MCLIFSDSLIMALHYSVVWVVNVEQWKTNGFLIHEGNKEEIGSFGWLLFGFEHKQPNTIVPFHNGIFNVQTEHIHD